MTYEKIVLITRKTRLEGLIERFNTKSQARFYISQNEAHAQRKGKGAVEKKKRDGEGSFALYEQEHETYYEAVETLKKSLRRLGKVQDFERGFLPNFVFAPTDLVVTIGIDGLVVNTAKYLTGQPLIAVNPDPAHIDGVLLPFDVAEAPRAVQRTLGGSANILPISMAEARLNDGQTLLAFNDLFIGAKTHVSARYQIRWGHRTEAHSSSGIIVSTGVGSTGWLSSMFNMANGLLEQFSGGAESMERATLPWQANELLFVVREPFLSKTSQIGIVSGRVRPQHPLIIASQMADNGVIFSDGVESDFLAFNAGSIATIGLAERKTNLVVK